MILSLTNKTSIRNFDSFYLYLILSLALSLPLSLSMCVCVMRDTEKTQISSNLKFQAVEFYDDFKRNLTGVKNQGDHLITLLRDTSPGISQGFTTLG